MNVSHVLTHLFTPTDIQQCTHHRLNILSNIKTHHLKNTLTPLSPFVNTLSTYSTLYLPLNTLSTRLSSANTHRPSTYTPQHTSTHPHALFNTPTHSSTHQSPLTFRPPIRAPAIRQYLRTPSSFASSLTSVNTSITRQITHHPSTRHPLTCYLIHHL